MRPLMKRALEEGTEHKVAGTTYFGSNPVYQQLPDSKMIIKVKPGIPWVNVDKQKKKELMKKV